jgi:excisionase family DNA binding protein
MSHILPQSTGRRALSVKEFRRITGLSHSLTYRLINSGKIKSIKVFRRRLILDDSVDDLMREGA